MPELLVSVRNASEAAIVLAAGVDLVDIKEPRRGSLGRADEDVIQSVLQRVDGRVAVSAALGELSQSSDDYPFRLRELSFVKWGLAQAPPDWRQRWSEQRQSIETISPCRVVLTAYADWQRAQAPPLDKVAHLAVGQQASVLLIDTWHKDGTTLLDWLSLSALVEVIQRCRDVQVRVALAGSLSERTIRQLLPLAPDWFAVRGAVCRDADRAGELDEERVRRLVDLVRGD